MVKFHLKTKTGKDVIGLGISERNIELLKQEKPIIIDLAEHMGLPNNMDIVLLYGKDEAALQSMIEGLIGPATRVEYVYEEPLN